MQPTLSERSDVIGTLSGSPSVFPRSMVSAVVAVRNEERHIESVLTSLLQQHAPNFDLEFIIVDGDSCDATQDITRRIATADPRVKLAVNTQKKTPYAFNIGVNTAKGDYVCILGAHTVYARDYIATCLEELRVSGAVGCSGREWVRAGGRGLQATLVAWALAHPFGTSTGSMRTRGAGFADSVPYPVFLKRALLEVGGYHTQLHRNQDNDLCQRLRSKGHTLYITDKTSCEYFVSPDLLSLSRYAFKTGFWNFISLKINPASMAPRHFVPAAFVTAVLFSLLAYLLSLGLHGEIRILLRSFLFVLATLYGLGSLAAACHTAFRERALHALLLPIGFIVLHFSYGVGTLAAMMRNARPPACEMSST